MRQLYILISEQLRSSLRTRKALFFLLLYLGVFAGSMWLFFKIQERFAEEVLASGVSSFQRAFMERFALNFLENAADDHTVLDFLLHVPVVNVILYTISLLGTPLLVLLLGYEKLAQEVYDGTVRYLVFRTSRMQIFFSKYVSSMLEIGVVTALATVFILSWASMKVPGFQWKEVSPMERAIGS